MSWMIIPENPAASGLLLGLLAMFALYAARAPVHGLIAALVRAVAGTLRLSARWFFKAADDLRARNRAVLFAHGRKELEKQIEREFQRVVELVKRDLGGYPALQRRVIDQITRVEEDYKKCGEVPPPPPEWVQAVESISAIKNSGDGLVQKILGEISESLQPLYKKVVNEYRRSYEERHKILKGFMPQWRALEQTLAKVDVNVKGIQDNTKQIDGLMAKYQELHRATDKAEHQLAVSASTQFAISAVVMLVAFGGAFVNFWLIQRPMSAMVGAGEYIFGNVEASHIAALVIILIESAMGIFLLETLRITHLFPGIGAMNDGMRRSLMWVFLGILTVLAGVEVGLAVMRDQIIMADLAFKQDLAGVGKAAKAATDLGWVQKVPVAGQMILGFILPFALAFVGIPLEYFIQAARSVLGTLLALALRGTGMLLRLSANVMRHLGTALAMLFDVLVFMPVLIERWVRHKGGGGAGLVTRTGGRAS